MATTAENRKLAQEAEERLDWRSAVIYWSRALDAYPSSKGALAQADKDKIITAINADKEMLLSMCPVCGDHMHGTLCPDDIIRPWCPTCHKAYTPMGYTTDDDYAKKWCVREYSRDKAVMMITALLLSMAIYSAQNHVLKRRRTDGTTYTRKREETLQDRFS